MQGALVRLYVHPYMAYIGRKEKRIGSPAHHYKDDPDDQKRWFTTDPLSGILKELGENLSVEALDEPRFEGQRTTWPAN
jgi:hypothetical protein